MSPPRLVFTLLVAGVVAALTLPAADDAEDKEIRSAATGFSDAFWKGDLAALDACTAKSFTNLAFETRADFLQTAKAIFAGHTPVKWESTAKSIRRDPDGKVVVRVEYRATTRPKEAKTEVQDKGLWAVTLVKEGGKWKTSRYELAYIEVFERAFKAKTKEERRAIFRAEGDEFLDRELFPKLEKELEEEVLESGKYEVAEAIVQVLEDAAEVFKDERERAARKGGCLLTRGAIALAQAKHKEAAEAFEAARVLFTKHGWDGNAVTAMGNLLIARATLGDLRGAVEIGEVARTALMRLSTEGQQTLGPRLLVSLGQVYTDLGNYPQAKKDLEQALRWAEKTGNARTARTARHNIANVHFMQGQYVEAVRIYKAVIAEAREAGHFYVESRGLINLSTCLREMGRMAEALRTLEEAHKLAVKVRDIAAEAETLTNLGLAYFEVDARADALRFLHEALTINKSIGNKSGVGRCRLALGMLQLQSGNVEEAGKEFTECLAIARDNGTTLELAQTNFFIAFYYSDAREWKKAGVAFDAALKLYQKLGNLRRALLAHEGWLYALEAAGDKRFDEQFAKFRRDAESLKDPVPLYAVHWFAARQALRQEKWELASTEAQSAIRLHERRRLLIEDPQLQASFSSDGGTPSLYVIDVAARAAIGDPTGAFHTAERAKSRSLIDLLERGRRSIQKGMTPDEKQREEILRGEVAAAARILTSARRNLNDEPGKLVRVEAALRDAEAEYEKFRLGVFLAHPELRSQRGELPPVDLVALQKTVFAREPGLAILSYLVAAKRVLIVVVTAGEKPDGPARVVVRSASADQKELADAAESFWKACQNPKAGRPLSDELYQWLIEPVEKDIAGKKHLLIVPSYPLLTIPFQALAADKDSPYLIEQFAVSYAPSLSALLEMRKRGDHVRKNGRAGDVQMLAIGDVKFTPDLKELPASGPEADAVGKVFGNRSRVLKAKEATRPEVLMAMPSARFLHFATHGLVNPPRPLFSALAVTQEDEKDDGRLYAHDVMNLELTAELVVLSACDTGRGKEYRGEGTIGLTWAFFVAGTPAMMVSQWSVADDTTAELMRGFYTRLHAGKDASKAESLRQVALGMLKDRKTRHPMYWAPFILTGDWRN